MSLFGLGDIKFKKGIDGRSGPLESLAGSKYEKTNFRFPIDVGSADKGHYMVFYIKTQKASQFDDAAGNMESETAFEAQAGTSSAMSGAGKVSSQISSASNKVAGSLGAGQNFAGKVSSKINAAADKVGSAIGGVTSKISEVGGNVQSGLNNVFGQKKLPLAGNSAAQRSVISKNIASISSKRKAGEGGIARTTSETQAAITLYMPDTLLFNFSQSFQQANPGKELAGQVAAASGVDSQTMSGGGPTTLSGVSENVKKAGERALLQIGAATGGALTGSPGSAAVAIAAATGSVVNPMLEMVYSSPNFRSFQFDFNFYPRDEREALEVQKILKLFMFHQAPEVLQTSPGFLVPPSEFDIKFYYAGKENPNIPVIAPNCVLTTMDLNYAPQGAVFYESFGGEPSLGGTGMPFGVNLVLQFQETIFLTKKDLKHEREGNKSDNGSISGGGSSSYFTK